MQEVRGIVTFADQRDWDLSITLAYKYNKQNHSNQNKNPHS